MVWKYLFIKINSEIILTGRSKFIEYVDMNLGQLNLALKMIQEEYKITDSQVQILSRRMMADEREFERMWNLFRNRRMGKSDTFIELLRDLVN